MSTKNTPPLAQLMREQTATSGYRKCIAEMKKMQANYSVVTHVYISNPDEATIERLQTEGFQVERTKITNYVQYKVSW